MSQTGCKVTIFDRLASTGRRGGQVFATCDQPVTKYGLCAKHYADRVRLGGSK